MGVCDRQADQWYTAAEGKNRKSAVLKQIAFSASSQSRTAELKDRGEKSNNQRRLVPADRGRARRITTIRGSAGKHGRWVDRAALECATRRGKGGAKNRNP